MRQQVIKSISAFFAIPWKKYYRARRLLYQLGIFTSHQLPVPVFSVGNLAFGGTGKTPIVLWLANYIQVCQRFPVILTRGYKGNREHGRGILSATDRFKFDSKEYGDEPVLIAKTLEDGAVVVGANRIQNYYFYCDRFSNEVVILDDGHQHLKIRRNLNIVTFDALMALSSYQTAPLGYLREDLSALKRAEVIVISRARLAGESKVRELQALIQPFIRAESVVCTGDFQIRNLIDIEGEKVAISDFLRGKKVFAFAGIASPHSFFKLIEDLDCIIVKTQIFSDHHSYHFEDISGMEKEAQSLDAVLLTTEKDLVKVKNITNSNLIFAVQVEFQFFTGEMFFKQKITEVLNHYPRETP